MRRTVSLHSTTPPIYPMMFARRVSELLFSRKEKCTKRCCSDGATWTSRVRRSRSISRTTNDLRADFDQGKRAALPATDWHTHTQHFLLSGMRDESGKNIYLSKREPLFVLFFILGSSLLAWLLRHSTSGWLAIRCRSVELDGRFEVPMTEPKIHHVTSRPNKAKMEKKGFSPPLLFPYL